VVERPGTHRRSVAERLCVMLGNMRRHAMLSILIAMTVAACAPAPVPSPSRPTSPTPSAASSPSAAPSAAQQASKTWVGDPITVAQAIDHRDNHLDDTELAVEGFAWTALLPCPLNRRPSPAMLQCPDNFTWISDEDPGPPAGGELINPEQPAI